MLKVEITNIFITDLTGVNSIFLDFNVKSIANLTIKYWSLDTLNFKTFNLIQMDMTNNNLDVSPIQTINDIAITNSNF